MGFPLGILTNSIIEAREFASQIGYMIETINPKVTGSPAVTLCIKELRYVRHPTQ